jgi:hypothetical protein
MPLKKGDTGLEQYMIRIAWTAHRGAPTDTGAQAEDVMHRLLPAGSFVMTESQPDIILFMSGGSERRAIELPEKQIEELREKPLGNHLLVVPCRCQELLRLLYRYKNIKVVS